MWKCLSCTLSTSPVQLAPQESHVMAVGRTGKRESRAWVTRRSECSLVSALISISCRHNRGDLLVSLTHSLVLACLTNTCTSQTTKAFLLDKGLPDAIEFLVRMRIQKARKYKNDVIYNSFHWCNIHGFKNRQQWSHRRLGQQLKIMETRRRGRRRRKKRKREMRPSPRGYCIRQI